MSIPEKSYSTPGLKLGITDRNPWLIANKYYTECLVNYYSLIRSKPEFEKELARADLNTVCKKELEGLKSIVADIRYKEVLGVQSVLARNDFYEEIDVKFRN